MRTKGGVLMICKMLDVHSHIVPSVDDGAMNIDMSIEMLRHHVP